MPLLRPKYKQNTVKDESTIKDEAQALKVLKEIQAKYPNVMDQHLTEGFEPEELPPELDGGKVAEIPNSKEDRVTRIMNKMKQ